MSVFCSTFHYEETGSIEKSSGGFDTETSFAIELDSTTDIDITATDTIYSEWTLINLGEEDEDVTGFSIANSDSETVLDYDSEFTFLSRAA